MFDRTRRFFGRRAARLSNYTTKNLLNTDALNRGGQEAKKSFDTLKERLGRPKVIHHETFENAYERMDLTEEKLGQAHRYQTRRFYVFCILAAFTLGALFHVTVNTHRFLAIAPLLAFLLVCLSIMFSASFVLYEIQRREFFPAREWVRHPEAWFPAPFKAATMTPAPTARPSATIHSLPARGGKRS